MHKDLICLTEFFKGAFMSSFAEAQEGVMYLPDDSPSAFDLYVEWAYRSEFQWVTPSPSYTVCMISKSWPTNSTIPYSRKL